MYKFILFTFVILTISCQNNNKQKEENTTPEGIDIPEVIEISDPSVYTEYHENGQLKIEGNFDDNGLRTGRWISYYENGLTWSESYYVAGKKDGHSVTFFPNGKVRYIGEYKNDEKIGRWTFKDEEGNVVDEKSY